MALYDTPWGRRELPHDEALQLRGQLGGDGIVEVTDEQLAAEARAEAGEQPAPELAPAKTAEELAEEKTAAELAAADAVQPAPGKSKVGRDVTAVEGQNPTPEGK